MQYIFPRRLSPGWESQIYNLFTWPNVARRPYSETEKKTAATLYKLTRGVPCLSCMAQIKFLLLLLLNSTYKSFPSQSSGELPGPSACGTKVELFLLANPRHCCAPLLCMLVSCCKSLSSGPHHPAAL